MSTTAQEFFIYQSLHGRSSATMMKQEGLFSMVEYCVGRITKNSGRRIFIQLHLPLDCQAWSWSLRSQIQSLVHMEFILVYTIWDFQLEHALCLSLFKISITCLSSGWSKLYFQSSYEIFILYKLAYVPQHFNGGQKQAIQFNSQLGRERTETGVEIKNKPWPRPVRSITWLQRFHKLIWSRRYPKCGVSNSRAYVAIHPRRWHA